MVRVEELRESKKACFYFQNAANEALVEIICIESEINNHEYPEKQTIYDLVRDHNHMKISEDEFEKRLNKIGVDYPLYYRPHMEWSENDNKRMARAYAVYMVLDQLADKAAEIHNNTDHILSLHRGFEFENDWYAEIDETGELNDVAKLW